MARKMVPLAETGHRMGEGHGSAKLTQAQVDEIRDILDFLEKHFPKIPLGLIAALAVKYGVSKTAIRKIADYVTWAEAPKAWKMIPSEEAP